MILALVLPALAAPRADAVTYTYGGTTLSGYVVYDDATTTKRPGLVMVPNWMGINETAIAKAKLIAGTRYVVLLADMYGKDVRPKTQDEAQKAATAVYGDRAAMRGRANAALDALKVAKAPVDATKLGAIGFCFGGSSVLELARSGTALDGVVSFHGGLSTESPGTKFNTPLLVINGGADGYVSAADITSFQAEVATAGADWQFVQMGGAVHCFTETEANSPGCMYDAKVATRAYGMMSDFFDEVLK